MRWLTHQQLKSKQAPVRRRAAETLARTAEPSDFNALVGALRDKDALVRLHVVNAICKIEHQRRTDALLLMLSDPNPEVPRAALAGLKNAKDDRIHPALVPLLQHPDTGIRGYVATLLTSRGWKPGTADEELTYLIARGQFAKAAAYGAAAIEPLQAAIQTGSFTQRVAAVEALGNINDDRVLNPLREALKSDEPSVCTAAVDALSTRGGPDACEALPAVLQHADANVRAAAVEALGRVAGPSVLDALMPMLKDPVWDVRRAAASTLGKLRNAKAVGALSEALADEDADVREAAAHALGNLNNRRAITPLVKALADPTSGVRRIAASAVSRIDENWSTSAEARMAVEELKSVMDDTDSELRYTIGRLLQNLGIPAPEAPGVQSPTPEATPAPESPDKLAVQLFLDVLEDSHPILRQAAAQSLGQLGDAHAGPALRRALGDDDEDVRLAAGQALMTLGIQ